MTWTFIRVILRPVTLEMLLNMYYGRNLATEKRSVINNCHVLETSLIFDGGTLFR